MQQSPIDNPSAGVQPSQGSVFDPARITRPDPTLMRYYVICALFTVFGFPFVILPLLFKYRTLKYAFDDKGVSMSYGLLFRKEVYLTYRRIQDIHVTRNIIQRWLGLAAVAVQTASGSAAAEMTLEGITDPEALRDYLYSRMRGAREGIEENVSTADAAVVQHDDEALALLHEIRDELRALRSANQGHGAR